jgi:hypothetical protein
MGRIAVLVPMAAAIVVAACSSPTAPTALPPSELDQESRTPSPIPGVSIYGLGGAPRPDGRTICTAPRFREFDFWRGDWSVSTATNPFVAINPVTAELGGCVVEEHWRPNFVAGGSPVYPGRSLSSYDDLTQSWRQTWVAAGARPLRLSGNLRPDGVMEMQGIRIHWFFGYHYIDTYTWTAVSDHEVIQAPTFDLPELNLHFAGSLDYVRAKSLPAVTSSLSDKCHAGGEAEETRNLDFTLGRWLVRTEEGALVGRSTIESDRSLSDCLLEETFSGPSDYRAIGWLYFDVIVNRYFRTYVDNQGHRLELEGAYANGKLVLQSTQPIPGNMQVRLTWEPVSGGLRQTWETSSDGGTTWSTAQVLEFMPAT